jgi:hypothetical protein
VQQRIGRRFAAAWAGSLVIGIVAGLVVAAVSPLRAEPERVALVDADPRVRVERDNDVVSIVPADGDEDVGLVFYPGVDVLVHLAADRLPRLEAHHGELRLLAREDDRTERRIRDGLLLDVPDPAEHAHSSRVAALAAYPFRRGRTRRATHSVPAHVA